VPGASAGEAGSGGAADGAAAHANVPDGDAPRGQATPGEAAPVTPDGRYLVVRGRLWRRSDPALAAEVRATHVGALMDARRAVGAALRAGDRAAEREARAAVHAAKLALGERGPPWWRDGAPDYNRHLARNTPYAAWWAAHERSTGERAG
jgi:hypothetical protein